MPGRVRLQIKGPDKGDPIPRIPPSPCLEVRDRCVPVLSGLVLFPSPAEGPEGLKLWTGPGMCAQTCARALAAIGAGSCLCKLSNVYAGFFGGRARARTWDPLINSQLLFLRNPPSDFNDQRR